MSDSDSFTRFVSELWKVRALIVTTHATFRHKCRRNNNFGPQKMNPNFAISSFRSGLYRFYGVEIWDAIKQFRNNCPFTPLSSAIFYKFPIIFAQRREKCNLLLCEERAKNKQFKSTSLSRFAETHVPK